jgi:hypothetical protein
MPYDTLPEKWAGPVGHPPVGFSSKAAEFSTVYHPYAPVRFPLIRMRSDSLLGATKQIEERFQKLASDWQREVGPSSSIRRKLSHPIYREIVAMGWPSVPFILMHIKNRPSHLVWALAEITGEDPTDRSMARNILDVIDAWIAWGRNKGYEV